MDSKSLFFAMSQYHTTYLSDRLNLHLFLSNVVVAVVFKIQLKVGQNTVQERLCVVSICCFPCVVFQPEENLLVPSSLNLK